MGTGRENRTKAKGREREKQRERERKGRVFTASFTHNLPCLPPTATQHVRLSCPQDRWTDHFGRAGGSLRAGRLGRGEATQAEDDMLGGSKFMIE